MSARRLPVTLCYLGASGTVAAVTGTWKASITHAQLEAYGMSPHDLRTGAWWRLVTSAFVTHGASVFWGSMLLAAFAIGLAELRHDARETVVTFVTAHVVSLVIVSLVVVLPMEAAQLDLGTYLAGTRDVGGSAGYYACLALGISALDRPLRRWLLVVVAVILVARLGIAIWLEAEHTTIHGDVAHPISFVIGLLIARYWNRLPRLVNSTP